jgi:uncharacterized protein (TIGR00251 family)
VSLAEHLVAVREGVLVTIKVTPRARHEGLEAGGAEAALKVRVTAPPEDGKANAAVIALLAKRWDVPKSALDIAAGGSARLKRVLVRGEPAALLRHLTARMGAP